MPIALHCSCGRDIRAKDDLAGKKVRCPVCQKILTVPDHELEIVSDDEPMEVLPADEPSEDAIQTAPCRKTIQECPVARREEEERPRKRRRRMRRDTPSWGTQIVFEPSAFGSINGGMIGGFLTMGIAAIWIFFALSLGRFPIFAPILFAIGVAAVIKGALGG